MWQLWVITHHTRTFVTAHLQHVGVKEEGRAFIHTWSGHISKCRHYLTTSRKQGTGGEAKYSWSQHAGTKVCSGNWNVRISVYTKHNNFHLMHSKKIYEYHYFRGSDKWLSTVMLAQLSIITWTCSKHASTLLTLVNTPLPKYSATTLNPSGERSSWEWETIKPIMLPQTHVMLSMVDVFA